MHKGKFPAPPTPRARRATRLTLALCALALCAAPHSTAQTPPSAAAETSARDSSSSRDKGTINVRIVGEDGQPVAGAVVSAFQQGSNARVSFDNSGAASGRYVLTNLDPGVYRVLAYAPGYVEETDPAADPSEPRGLYRPGDSVTLRMAKGGVVTGKVTDADGEAVVGARVAAVRVRDGADRPLRQTGPIFSGVRERRTDDRGVYRIYGMPPGTYIVLAGGRTGANLTSRPSAYDSDTPTYYPSATRDGAVEVQVQAGQELTDIDIRHRGEQGYAVSGTVTGAFATGNLGQGGVSVVLKHLSGATAAFAFVYGTATDGTRSFTFEGVADGDYEVSAASNSGGNETGSGSAPLRLTVRGAEVTGLRLTLVPLGSIAGRVSFEPLPAADAKRAECQNVRAPVPQESLIFTRREGGTAGAAPFSGPRESVPDARGEFIVRNLEAGRYRFAPRLLNELLFIRAITLRAGETAAGTAAGAAGVQTPAAEAAAARAAADLARSGFTVKSGDRLAGVTVSVGAGASGLNGRVVPATEGEAIHEALRVYLVPAERERAEDVLRYHETRTRPDGAFSFRHLAPGHYLLVARPVPEGELRAAEPPRPAAWDAAARADLRREAEAAKNPVALLPCQRAEEFALRFGNK